MKNSKLLIALVMSGALLAVLALAPVTADGQEKTDAKVAVKVKGGPFPLQVAVSDPTGKLLRTVGEPGLYGESAFSPDGTRLAVVEILPEYSRIWVFDLSTGAGKRLTSTADVSEPFEDSPVWSPDSSQIAYSAFRQNGVAEGGVYRKAVDGTGSAELLYRHLPTVIINPTDWSPDGRFLALSAGEVVWVVPLTGERKAVELVREEFQVYGARFSPNSRFLAYVSDESGRNEIHVRPFDPDSVSLGTGKWQVSSQGGLGLVQWRPDGKELYYLAADGGVMAVEVTTASAFTAGPPRLLSQAPGTFRLGGVNYPTCSCAYSCEPGSISRDGQRVVFDVPMPPERKVITVAPEILAQYAGTYMVSNTADAVVTLEGNQLMLQWRTRKDPLFAESETYFFLRNPTGDSDFEFVRDDKGVVTHFVSYNGDNGQKRVRR